MTVQPPFQLETKMLHCTEQLSIDPAAPAVRRSASQHFRSNEPLLPDTQPSHDSFTTAFGFTQGVLAPDSQPNGKPPRAQQYTSDASMGQGDPDSLPFGPTAPASSPMIHMMSIDSAPSASRQASLSVQKGQHLTAQPSSAGSKRKEPASAFSDDSSLSDVSDNSQARKNAASAGGRQNSLPDSGLKSSTPGKKGSSKASEPSSKRAKGHDPPTPLRQSARLRNRSAGR